MGFALAAASMKPLILYGPTLPVGTLDLGLLESLHVDFCALLIGGILAVLIAFILTALPLRLAQRSEIISNLRSDQKVQPFQFNTEDARHSF